MNEQQGWVSVLLKGNINILTGYSFSSKHFNETEGVPLIRIRDLLTHTPITRYLGNYDSKYLVEKRDILIGMDGEFNIVRWKGPKSLLNQRVAKITSNNDELICEGYLFYKLIKELKTIEALTPATTVKHLAKKDIEQLNLMLPPLNEQKKIAAILSSVDEAIEKTEQIITQTEKVKKGLMQQLLTKGIGHTKFKNTAIGEIPEEWETKNLKEILIKIVGGGTPSRKKVEFFNGSIPWATVKDLNKFEIKDTIEYISTEGLNNSAANLIPANSVIVSTRMAVGRAFKNKVDMAINQDLKALIVDSNFIISDFLLWYYTHKSSDIKRLGTGTTVKGIRLEDLRELIVLLPPIEEQKKIVEVLSLFNDKVFIENQKLDKLKSLKKGLMQQLLTGRARVPVDEDEVVET
ncbi:restriction endonuclease subunit S [Salimicrobium humidisoli]|uniref:Restriction endonuclease n=1 Tax=Salimicrobium humidisoli TaxID=2029857 RepID=A0ABX4HWS7_9BACI|nr:restriction endonuclease subunit S [Salimicrobium humidisoli]PBB06941.1 restriction endonuclease [Salimicrobium humidisoli]